MKTVAIGFYPGRSAARGAEAMQFIHDHAAIPQNDGGFRVTPGIDAHTYLTKDLSDVKCVILFDCQHFKNEDASQ